MALTVADAFLALKSNLEITLADEQQAIKRRDEVYDRLRKDFDLVGEPVKSGSFSRDTKTKPLKDVDFLCVLHSTDANEEAYLDRHPRYVIADFAASLEKRYSGRVSEGRRSVRVDFGSAERIQSYDVVPAFTGQGTGYQIPDRERGEWISSDPSVHARLATEANQRWDKRWKPIIKMLKAWNRKVKADTGDSAVRPSFLLEVIGLEYIEPLIDYPYDLQVAFNTLANEVEQDWEDPAGLGPAVNEMSRADRRRARQLLEEAGSTAQSARRAGSPRQAIIEWRELFGSLMPLD